jgi:hypothetical protein
MRSDPLTGVPPPLHSRCASDAVREFRLRARSARSRSEASSRDGGTERFNHAADRGRRGRLDPRTASGLRDLDPPSVLLARGLARESLRTHSRRPDRSGPVEPDAAGARRAATPRGHRGSSRRRRVLPQPSAGLDRCGRDPRAAARSRLARRFWTSLRERTEARVTGAPTSEGPAMQDYPPNRPLRNWLVDRLSGSIESAMRDERLPNGRRISVDSAEHLRRPLQLADSGT